MTILSPCDKEISNSLHRSDSPVGARNHHFDALAVLDYTIRDGGLVSGFHHELAHHARVFVFQDVAMVHVGTVRVAVVGEAEK